MLLAGLALAGAMVPPYLAERETEAARNSWRIRPEAAFDRLDRAASLNPLNDRPQLVAGSIGLELGRFAEAEARFRKALSREADNWFPNLVLGLLASARGERPTAVRRLRRARSLDPRESVVRSALRRLDGPSPLMIAEAVERLETRARERIGR